VVSDITGVTGMAIIKAILRGERDPLLLAKYRHDKCQRTEAEIARALYGNWREEHLFALKQAVQLYEFYQQQLRDCDARLEAYLGTFADKTGGRKLPYKPRQRKRTTNEARFDARGLLHRLSGVDLTIIEGIDESTALVVLSEIGTDMSKFPTVKQQAVPSRAALAPGDARSIRVQRARFAVGASAAAPTAPPGPYG